ncbi:hypothetical protein CDL12_18853 [Handroanthus impetiginosus]|uniref:Uncharacterized protein n=1 Tax=Handroanthus impetiginosus TaxID=429701 RepID=A0A2G9GTE6_9LAMI|nr:hypothetical protein CDL12_18853 [Handroanthus impetiginosus]
MLRKHLIYAYVNVLSFSGYRKMYVVMRWTYVLCQNRGLHIHYTSAGDLIFVCSVGSSASFRMTFITTTMVGRAEGLSPQFFRCL